MRESDDGLTDLEESIRSLERASLIMCVCIAAASITIGYLVYDWVNYQYEAAQARLNGPTMYTIEPVMPPIPMIEVTVDIPSYYLRDTTTTEPTTN